MSALLALATPRRIKASHRRRRKVAAGRFVYQHTDSLGSIVAETDASRVVVKRNHYEPYGGAFNSTIDGTGYTGHVMDQGTGLTYMQARYYDPQIGIFYSVDPMAVDTATAFNFNRYAYANNNPYRFTDPDGRVTFDEVVSKAKEVIAPTGSELAKRGEPGTLSSNLKGAAKQVGNTVIGLAEAAIPVFRLTGLPRMEIANNQLEGAAAAEFVTSVAAVGAPLARGAGAMPTTASGYVKWSEAKGFARSQTASGPIKYSDANGIVRVTIKQGSSRAPGSAAPHVELRNAAGQRVNPAGNPVARRSPDNHTPIEWDLD